jgi:outer membrane protein OmpA-like peptidoglycan-associated protein
VIQAGILIQQIKQKTAKILKYFPNSSIKIGGYTDNIGDSSLNKKISDERAKTVMKELIKLGAGTNQITEAVGYGPEHPVCPPNDTPECKARNRRVDLKVATK